MNFDIAAARERARKRLIAEQTQQTAAKAQRLAEVQQATDQARSLTRLLKRFYEFALQQPPTTRETFSMDARVNTKSRWRGQRTVTQIVSCRGWRVSEWSKSYGTGYDADTITRALFIGDDGTLYGCRLIHHTDPSVSFRMEWKQPLTEDDVIVPTWASSSIVERIGEWLAQHDLEWTGE